ncbi:MAG: T9SS type A sorting domain-containing protein [Bacteroidia bacterium]
MSIKIKIFITFCFFLLHFVIFSKTENKNEYFFVENKNQITNQFNAVREDIRFVYDNNSFCTYFKNNGISYQFNKIDNVNNQISTYRLDVSFLNHTKEITSHGEIENNLKLNFYNNSSSEYFKANTFKEIIYKNVYRNINLRYYFKNDKLKYDYEVEANTNYKQIQLKIEGAKKIYINKKGSLVIVTPYGNITEDKPIAFQNGKLLKANWVINKNILSFNIENVNPNQKLTIDPLVRLWGTYNGGGGQDVIYYSKVDASNNVYVSGYTNSTFNIATVGTFQNTFGGQSSQVWGDAFVTKYNSSGVRLWSTYFGGNGSDFGSMLNIDATGNVYLVGATLSTNTMAIATPLAHQTNYGGGTNTGDAFIVKFDSNGLRLWSTYYGGSGDDYADGATLDNLGNLYLTGVTSSTATNVISTTGSFQQTYGGGANDAFLAKFDSNGNRLWATYIGGNGIDNGLGCNFDSFGNVLIAGYTTSTNNIATTGAHQINFAGGSIFGDGFLAQFDTNGNRLYGTYYGGIGDDYIGNVVSNSLGDVFISGSTSTNSSTTIATFGSYQANYGGGSYDFFLTKFNTSFIRQWGTYYGGSGNDEMGYCVVNNIGLFISGRTTSASQSVLTTSCSYQPAYGGGFTDVCLSKFDFNGNRIWSTLYGGSGTEDSPGICCSTNNVYLTGASNSSSGNIIASMGSQQPIYGGGGSDGFIVKFDGCQNAAPPNSTSFSNMQVCFNNSTVLSTSVLCGINWYNVPTGGVPLFSGSTYSTPNLITNSTFYIEEITCGSSTRTAVQVTVLPQPTISASANPSIICNGQNSTLTINGANTYSINNNSIGSNTNSAISPSLTTTYTITGEDNNGCYNSTLLTVSVSPCMYLQVNDFANTIKVFKSSDLEYLQINCQICISNNFQVQIINSSGQIIYNNTINNQDFKIPLSSIGSGLYLIVIRQNNKIVYTSKLLN